MFFCSRCQNGTISRSYQRAPAGGASVQVLYLRKVFVPASSIQTLSCPCFWISIELISDKVAGPTLVVSSSYKDFQISNREISQERGMWNHRPVVDGYKLSASCESGYSEKWVLWFSKSEKSHTLVPRWPQLWRRRHWSTAPLWRPDPLRRHGETFHLTRNKHWDTPQSSSSDRKYRAYRRGWCSWCFCWSRFWRWRALWWSRRGSKSGESQRKHVIFL